MARGGINKAVVQKARHALLARGAHPSIDAVRIELGNTGSKSSKTPSAAGMRLRSRSANSWPIWSANWQIS